MCVWVCVGVCGCGCVLVCVGVCGCVGVCLCVCAMLCVGCRYILSSSVGLTSLERATALRADPTLAAFHPKLPTAVVCGGREGGLSPP